MSKSQYKEKTLEPNTMSYIATKCLHLKDKLAISLSIKQPLMEYPLYFAVPNQRFPSFICMVIDSYILVPKLSHQLGIKQIYFLFALDGSQEFSSLLSHETFGTSHTLFGKVTNLERVEVSISHGTSCWYYHSILGTGLQSRLSLSNYL